jgi:hypothetical protein
MDQHPLGGAGRFDQVGKTPGEVGVRARGGDKVGFQPDREKDIVGRKASRDLGPVGRAA